MLPPIDIHTNADGIAGTRIAPSFIVANQQDTYNPRKRVHGFEHAYSVKTLTEFLGWPEYKIASALAGLALIESQTASETMFRGLSSAQARHVAIEVNRVERQQTPHLGATLARKLARHVGEHLAAGMQEDNAVGPGFI